MSRVVRVSGENTPVAMPLESKLTEPTGCAAEMPIAAGGMPVPPEALMVIPDIAVLVEPTVPPAIKVTPPLAPVPVPPEMMLTPLMPPVPRAAVSDQSHAAAGLIH